MQKLHSIATKQPSVLQHSEYSRFLEEKLISAPSVLRMVTVNTERLCYLPWTVWNCSVTEIFSMWESLCSTTYKSFRFFFNLPSLMKWGGDWGSILLIPVCWDGETGTLQDLLTLKLSKPTAVSTKGIKFIGSTSVRPFRWCKNLSEN